MEDLIIDIAKINDLDSIVEVYKGWDEFKGILPDEFIQGDSKIGLLKYFNGKDISRKYITAKIKNKVIGVCYIDVSFFSLNCIRLGDMIINKNYRNKGIGSKMIDFVITYAKKNNIHKIWLWTQEELKDAIGFYKDKGFVLEGKQKKQFCNKDALILGYVL